MGICLGPRTGSSRLAEQAAVLKPAWPGTSDEGGAAAEGRRPGAPGNWGSSPDQVAVTWVCSLGYS